MDDVNWSTILDDLRRACEKGGVPPQQNGKYAALCSKEQIKALREEAANSDYSFNFAGLNSDPERNLTGLVGEYNGIEVWDWEAMMGNKVYE